MIYSMVYSSIGVVGGGDNDGMVRMVLMGRGQLFCNPAWQWLR